MTDRPLPHCDKCNDANRCPKCGAGLCRQDGDSIILHAPKGFPLEAQCDECEYRYNVHLEKIGEESAAKYNAVFMEAFTK